ncbi:MAG: 4Fe-4S binding protein [Dehalococcoidia bacterium]|nr:4Fe-4S binding protein [Dehalococcoidia bacterium]
MKFLSEYEAPWSSGAELHVITTGEWRYQRPVLDLGKCIKCAACCLFCPTGCRQDASGQFAVDLDYCKGCGICARVCPVGAITMEREP